MCRSTRECSLFLLSLVLFLAFATQPTRAQSSNESNVNEYWPGLVTTVDLGTQFRLQTKIENHTGLDGPFTQWELGALLSYHTFRRIRLRDLDNDDENNYDLSIGAGYFFVQSSNHGVIDGEHRLLVEATPKHHLGLGILAQDRSRLEFRWKETGYDFRYRNRLMIDRPLSIHGFKIIPYASGEWFWSRNAHAWDENRSAFGARLPFGTLFMLDLYYLRKNCTGCSRDHTDAIGTTLNIFLRRKKK